jgi:hypothetical protein
MITNTYDLNLYVIDGSVKVLAHELEFASDGHIQVGSPYQVAMSFPFKRANKALWRPILDFFGEDDLYDELDSWYGTAFYDEGIPFSDWESSGQLPIMPEILATAVANLPSYTMNDWRDK